MAYTEFYVQTTGSNLNAGSTNGNSAVYTATNGNWDGTSIYTPTDGSTPASTVSVGDFASIYLDAATVAVYIARVTAVAAGVNGAITLSTTAFSGTAPASGATGRSIKVGGAWKGPNGAVNFPVGLITGALTNASGNATRINFKGGTNYAITATITNSVQGPVIYQGYTTAIGDGGKATVDGGTAGASYNLLLQNGSPARCGIQWRDFIFQNNGATGTAEGVVCHDFEVMFIRCVFNSVRGYGYIEDSGLCYLIECEAYACNQSNNTNTAGLSASILLRCTSHDNTGSNSSGIFTTAIAIGCIADSNGDRGIVAISTIVSSVINCDAYNNGGSGIVFGSFVITSNIIENCNSVKNGGYGFDNPDAAGSFFFSNNAVGSGTQANGSGATNLQVSSSVTNENLVTYAANITPWVDPANGDFRINLAAAKNAGRGAFTETASSYSGSIGYPDIGAAQANAESPILVNKRRRIM